MPATLDDYRWLVSDAARPWLARVKEEPAGVTPALLQRLRKDLSAERAHLVVEQIELRHRAREKFSLADQMFFTRKGLEQATDEVVANFKAARFPVGGGCIDLCCGIGGDLLALARRGSVGGIDRDPIAVLFADANANAHGMSRAQCLALLAHMMREFPASTLWHCDPDRRVEGRRTTQIEMFEPSLDELNGHLRKSGDAAIKLAPATNVPLDWSQAAEREWLGSRGECRQQVCWFGALARHPGRHAATVVAADGSSRTVVGPFSDAVPVAEQLGRYLYEPHAAVLAANLTGTLCQQHDLAAVSSGIGYLTGDRLLADAALAAFEIHEVLPFDRKQLRAWCRQHNIGTLEVKKRGLDLDPQKLRTEIVASGDNAATLILTPIAGQARALIVQRLAT